MDHATAPQFQIALEVDCSPQCAWDRLWDLDRHERAIPATRIERTGPLTLGAHFTALTGPRWAAFRDEMVVRAWSPPSGAVIEKVGKVLGGTISVGIRPTASGSLVSWTQSVSIGTPTHRKSKDRFLDAITYRALPVIRAAYRRSIRRILRQN